MPIHPFENFLAWTSRPLAPPGYLNGDTMNLNTARGELWPDKGWIHNSRQAAAGDLAKAGGTFAHQHIDGTNYLWHAVDDALYNDAGAMVTSLTAKFAPATYCYGAPVGASGYFNGTNGQAKIIRLDTTLEDEGHDIIQPTTVTTFATSGGGILDGTYQIRVCWIDKDAAVPVFSEPSVVHEEIVTGGGGSATITVDEPAAAINRVTHFRISITVDGGTDTPSNYFQYDDVAKGAGNQTLTALPTDNSPNQAFVDINGVYRQGHLPLTGVDICVLHDERLWIASSTSNKVYFSERGNPNHWYTTNEAAAGAGKGWTGVVLGLASGPGAIYVFTAQTIHSIFGDFTRDDQGANPTYRINMTIDQLDDNFGGVNHGSIGAIGPVVYFWSSRGPAAIRGGSAGLILEDDIQDFVEKILDKTYLDRIVFTEDPVTHAACWLVPRKTNSTRPMDGASTAGICDRIVRYDPAHQRWMPPLWPGECVHINTRFNGAEAAKDKAIFLVGMGANHGAVKQFNIGHTSGGVADTSGALYDGLLATSEPSTTTAIVTASGVSADALIGKGVVIKYHKDDTGFPSAVVYKEITDNTATAGGSVTLTWAGALTQSTGVKWTLRIAGWDTPIDIRLDLRKYAEIPPDKSIRVRETGMRPHDVTGTEAVG